MDDLDALRQRRLQELQAQQESMAAQNPEAAQQQAQEAAARQQQAMDAALQQVLDPEARERFERIRLSRPDFATQVAQQLIAMGQRGRIANLLSDEDLRRVLQALSPQERETTIRRI